MSVNLIWAALIWAALGGYLLGSIPFGLLIARLAGQGDIRKIGSGNIGATNVLRTGRKELALLTLVLDAGKAGVAALIAGHVFGPTEALIAGGAALIGHCFPIWLGFRGGKGVATYFGALLAVAWPVFLIAGVIWLVCLFLTRIVSLSGIITALAVPLCALALGQKDIAVFCAALGLVIILRHAQNIGRIFRGEEPKIGRKS
ncbi:MAG TPA: glycerol-3-phosphate 1-O-acyltransferase [Hellea balneolensis]|uniref:Glycerol-3-phosphate acyltransferase n=1 Tax=Hellea balneolensis TaxID=287478 RepID=A0A7V5NWK1_9PROT|nr:glycerol-3-phosphate 1-O-acyltransferase [Hellea balneolensis]